MFKKIKTRLLNRGKVNEKILVKILQNHEDRLSALEGGDESSSEDTPSRNVKFTVNDGTNAVEGATVSIGTVTGTTGSAGGCTLSNITDGEVTVNVTKTGFENYSDTITVDENNTNFTISLTVSEN